MDGASGGDTATEPTSVFGAIAAVAARQPDAIALHDPETPLTFGTLADEALHLADQVAELPPGVIGLLVPSRTATVAAQIGLAAAARTFLPLDPTYPVGVLRDMMAVADVVALVVPPDLVGLATTVADGLPVLSWVPGSAPRSSRIAPDIAASDELTIYFTSGSTGGPKGVVHTQRNWVDAGLGMAAAGLSDPDRHYLLMSPVGFAAAGIITSFALFGGSSLSLYDARALGLSGLPAWIDEQGITTVVSIPSAIRAVIAAAGGKPLERVNHVIYGGEMVTHDDVRSARSLSGTVDTTLLYVSTELGVITSRTIASADPVPAEEPIHCGMPFSGGSISRIEVVTDNGDVCAGGVAGNVQVTSARLSWFVGEEGERTDGSMTLDTGDVGRLLPDGGLQLLGRSDQLVKIRGYRIDQGEVERQMRTLDGILDVSVVVGQTGRGSPQLVAHVVLDEDVVADAGAVRTELRDILPAYMIPARIFVTDALPRLRNGKVDRVTLRLAARPSEHDPAATIGRRLSTPTEKAIAEAFATVLGLASVEADDDFFDLGGSSLAVVELLVHLEDQLGIPIPASLLTHHTTTEQLAAALDHLRDERTSVITIQGSTSVTRPPIHLVYDLHGSPFRMRALASALGPDQPVQGFECPLIFGEPNGPTTFREIAAIHVADLVAAHPDGPYHLCGYSVGGALMFEIASQLIEQGRDVGFLAAIDFGPIYMAGSMPRRDGPKPPGSYALRAPVALRGLDRLRFHQQQLSGRSAFDSGAYLARLARVGREYELAAAHLDLRRHGQVRPELRSSWAWYHLLDAAQTWDIRPIDADITLFLCDQTAQGNITVSRRVDYASRTEPTLGWSKWARSVDVREIMGYHNALVEEPYVDGVGAAVRAAFDDWLAK